MVNQKIIQRKLRKIAQYIGELEPIGEKTFADYRADYLLKRTAERCIQLIVEAASDINGHILVEKTGPPSDYYESFIKMAETAVFSYEFAESIAPSAGLRNRLVHEYEEIKDRLVYQSISETIEQFTKYISHIEDFLNKQ